MKKTLPTFSVTGTLQELIEVEMILIMLGYDVPDERWNNVQVEDTEYPPIKITLFRCKTLIYLCFEDTSYNLIKATDTESIINYVTNYKGYE